MRRRPALTVPARRRLALLALGGLALAGCGGGTDDAAAPAASATAGDGSSAASSTEATEAPAVEGSEDIGAASIDGVGELAGLTATRPDGTTLTLGELEGEQVLVETFATWCSNCRQQLGDTQQAAAEAGDAARFLVLSVEDGLDPAQLEEYAAENGFDDLEFAVLDGASLQLLQEQFGGSVLVPPSTPKFTVGSDGSVGELVTGFESPEEILAQIDA